MKIKAFFADLIDGIKAIRSKRRAAKLDQLSCERINVTEFAGHVYVSFDGVPVVKTDHLGVPVTQLLESARKDYLAWKEKFDR